MIGGTEKTVVEAHIAEQEAELASLKEQVMRLEVSIEAGKKILALVAGVTNAPPESLLKAGSQVEKAYRVLAAANEPLHVGEIVRRLEIEDTPRNRNSLVGMIARYVRRGQIFMRTAPNTFGLLLQSGERGPRPEESEAPRASTGGSALFGGLPFVTERAAGGGTPPA